MAITALARASTFVDIAIPFIPPFIKVFVGDIHCDEKRVVFQNIRVTIWAGPPYNIHINAPHLTGATCVSALVKMI
jgi:hypothetical protein